MRTRSSLNTASRQPLAETAVNDSPRRSSRTPKIEPTLTSSPTKKVLGSPIRRSIRTDIDSLTQLEYQTNLKPPSEQAQVTGIKSPARRQERTRVIGHGSPSRIATRAGSPLKQAPRRVQTAQRDTKAGLKHEYTPRTPSKKAYAKKSTTPTDEPPKRLCLATETSTEMSKSADVVVDELTLSPESTPKRRSARRASSVEPGNPIRSQQPNASRHRKAASISSVPRRASSAVNKSETPSGAVSPSLYDASASQYSQPTRRAAGLSRSFSDLRISDKVAQQPTFYIDCSTQGEQEAELAEYKLMLEYLGAKVVERWVWIPERLTMATHHDNDQSSSIDLDLTDPIVTHVIWLDGTSRSLNKVAQARKLGKQVECLSVAWLVQCTAQQRLSIGTAGFEIDIEAELALRGQKPKNIEAIVSPLPSSPSSPRRGYGLQDDFSDDETDLEEDYESLIAEQQILGGQQDSLSALNTATLPAPTSPTPAPQGPKMALFPLPLPTRNVCTENDGMMDGEDLLECDEVDEQDDLDLFHDFDKRVNFGFDMEDEGDENAPPIAAFAVTPVSRQLTPLEHTSLAAARRHSLKHRPSIASPLGKLAWRAASGSGSYW
ncbi:hypothetical protein PYCC9005_004009 [Savitreella phatthalungensis]